MANIIGTPTDDNIPGTENADTIDGLAGNDTINGFGGEDEIIGGDGNDTLLGGDDSDVFRGGPGNDTINGEGEFDDIWYADEGGPNGVTVDLAAGTATDTFGGTDTLVSIGGIAGSNFADTLRGDADDNIIRSFRGNDIVDGRGGNDEAHYTNDTNLISVAVNLATGTAVETYANGTSTDTLISIERIRGSLGNDSLTGDDGNNRIRGIAGNDTIDGGAGRDMTDYSQDARYGGNQGVSVNLVNGTATDGFGNTDTLVSIEDARGTAFNDNISGDNGANQLEGGDGSDNINGGGGDDTVLGGNGDDLNLIGADGNDFIDGGPGNDIINGGAGNDTIDGAGGNNTADYFDSPTGVTVDLSAGAASDGFGNTDSLVNFANIAASSHADDLTGSSESNFVEAREGDDTVEGGGGDDDLEGGGGIDTAIYSGNIGDYIITELSDGSIRLEDNRGGVPDGIDTASDFEFFQFADGVVSVEDVVPPANSRVPVGAIEAVPGNDVLFGDAAGELADFFFFDTELIASLGKDSIKAFGPNDAIVTTSLIYDSNHDGIVKFGGNGKLDLAGATGDTPVNPHDASTVGQVEFHDPSGHKITQLHYDGSVEHDDTTYYVYSQFGSGVHVSDLVLA
ncbi:calcium-binding protein [Mesorhizobium delmotii]|uniref:Calcium-binding protein n=1 Tax=Mesorhizobium delmotii TaxID=1631247 RepID=A0A2P9AVB9_9HYPH|nr:calcium-binding protein [Mesorhizobium delmotii]SJM35142.1 hypothetical protein BQ8482_60153 [Mesorhizobium delmotii]